MNEDCAATFHVGLQKGHWYVTVALPWDELRIVEGAAGEAESAVAEMEQFIARAQAALDELREKIAGS